MVNVTFKSFCYEMYRENCRERFQFGEEELTFENYVLNNLDFLFDSFQKEMLDNS